MPPKHRVPGSTGAPVRRPKIAGSARSLNVPSADKSLADTDLSSPKPVADGAVEDVTPAPVTTDSTSTERPARTSSTDTAAEPDKVESKPDSKQARPAAVDLVKRGESGDIASGQAAGEPPAARRSTARGWRLVGVLGAITLLVAALAGVAYFKVGAKADDVAWIDDGATAEVLRVTPPALAAVFTFAPDTFDADFDKGVQGLDQSMRDQLTQYKDTQKAGVQQSGTATTADVPLIGITRLEADRAQVLAQLNVSSTQNGVAADSRSGMVLVSLEKQDGNWLISEIRDQ